MGKPRIENLHELGELGEQSHGEKYVSRHSLLGVRLGAAKLGFNVTELDPGKAMAPYHFHHVNEEMFLVLRGSGTVRTPEGEHPLREGDVLFCPAGPEGAHQIVNTGTEPLRYLALSTRQNPEVAEYPDSGKYGVLVEGGPGEDLAFHACAFKKDRVDYWAGED